jgi:hypothetical protein
MKCPDCGKEVSDAAPSCPGCGRPISQQSSVATARKGAQRARWRRDLGNALFLGGVMAGPLLGSWQSSWWLGGGIVGGALIAGLLIQYL